MSTGVMLAFIPDNTEWYKGPDFAHLTLVYCGDINSLEYTAFNELAKDAISVTRTMRPFTLDVLGVDLFGAEDEPKVDALRVQPTASVLTARQLVEKWNASQHDFNPHLTVGPQGSAEGMLPTKLYFGRLMAAWGNRQLIFPLNGSDY
jgi:2'-5' RNA ligase